MIGRSVGRFQILERIGQGGMASVWKARDELLGRFVAVKILNDAIPNTASVRSRFRHETEIAGMFEHPAIVPVYEAGEQDGLAYLVMKLVEGQTLAGFISARLQPVVEVLRIGATVADALAYAHARGVIHRDITPRNVMRAGDGRVFVLDFGLARILGGTASSSGHIVGTPSYVSPETLLGGQTDARSDIYSLGVVLYEALTGAPPFRGDRPETVSYSILHEPPEPPSRLRPELSGAIDALIMRMMAREPGERPATAEEVSVGLGCLRAALARDASGEARAWADPGTQAAQAAGADVPARGPPIPCSPASRAPRRALDTLAQRWISGDARAFLALLPIHASGGEDADGSCAHFCAGLAEALRAGLARLGGLHVVSAEDPPGTGEDHRSFARRIGANILLRVVPRFSGTSVRITFAILDPETGTQIAGGGVDGSRLQAFELEDRLVAAARAALGIAADGSDAGWRAQPHDPAAQERFAQALSYLRRTDHEASLDGAVRILEGLLASEGESAAVHAALARACVHKFLKTKQRGWESRAARSCERAAALDPYAPEVMLAMGEMHAIGGRHAQALVELDQALAARPDLYEAQLARARTLDGAGRAGEAEDACRRAIGQRPDDWRGYHELGLVLFRHGRYGEALGPWRRVTTLTPDNASAHRNLGSALIHLDRYDEALAALQRANEIRPDAVTFVNLGTVLYILGRYEECLPVFEKAVALNPSDPRIWGNLGNACSWIPGHEIRKREALERAVGLMRERLDGGPGEGDDWARLAGWLANLGVRDEAERAIRRALEMAPEDVHCMVAAAKTFLSLGARAEALGWVRRAVESGYGVGALRRIPELGALARDPEFEGILEGGSRPRGADVVS